MKLEINENTIDDKELDLSLLKSGLLHMGTDFKEKDFNSYVITGAQQNVESTIRNRVGRIIQVRLEDSYRGPVIFLRHCDDRIILHEDQTYYFVHDDYKEQLDELFKNTSEDSTDIAYGEIGGKNRKSGFIITENYKYERRQRIINKVLEE